MKTRRPFNREKTDAREWSSKIGEDIERLLGVDGVHKKYQFMPDKNLHILWNGGETLLHIHHNAMIKSVHNHVNSVLDELFFENTRPRENRRAVTNPSPMHMGPHEYSKTAAHKKLYKGHRFGKSNFC